MKKIAIATCAVKPEADPDEELLLARLRDKGASVRMVAWDGPSPEVGADEICVVRSTWNYFTKLEAFLAWVDRVPRLVNPGPVIHGNVRKTYLRDLEARGVAIVPTAWAGDAGAGDVAATMRERGWASVVIKPVVSAGSFATKRFTLAEAAEAQAFLDGTGREMMIQRWMPAVDTSGERSIVWIDGEVSHAIRKSPRFAGGHESVTSVEVAEDERELAERVLTLVPPGLSYARVDMVRDEGVLRLMELELVEPSLFLLQHPPALERFASALVAL
ncbi:MAG: hypothetical protein U0270_25375 [Labilithrix sp.]